MALREEKKQQTRQALIDAALQLMHDGGGFSGLSLREVAREAGLVPTGFYRHFPDMDSLGLDIASDACQTLRKSLRDVRRRVEGGAAISDSMSALASFIRAQPLHFEFLARESAGGALPLRRAIQTEMRAFTNELADDLGRWPAFGKHTAEDLFMIADLVVQAVIHLALALVSRTLDESEEALMQRTEKQLRLVMLGASIWKPREPAGPG